MRKGAGISGLQRHSATTSSYAALSTKITADQISALEANLASFREALQKFASEHRQDIRRDPAFRHQFQKMCAAIGVDPLSGSRSSSGKGGWWSDLLGLDEWEYEVAVQVVDVCVSTRESNGGMIEINELARRIDRLRGVQGTVTKEDIVTAVKILEPLSAGYKVHVAGGQTYVRSVPQELDTDQTSLLVLAAKTGGVLTIRAIKEAAGWPDVRAARALDDAVMREGMGWVDDQAGTGEREVWMMAAVKFDDGTTA